MEAFPVFYKLFKTATNSQGAMQHWTPEIPPQVDITYTNEQLFFLNELVAIRVHEMNQKMEDIEHKADVCVQTQKSHFTNLKSTTQQLTTSIVSESLTTLRISMNAMINEKMLHFENSLNQLVDETLQDVYAASKEGNKMLIQTMEQMISQFENKLRQKCVEDEEHLVDIPTHIPHVQ